MKYFTLFLIFCYSFTIQSQNNFKTENNTLTWQKVFNAENISTATLIKYFNTVPNINNISDLDNQIRLSVENDVVNYKKYGGKSMTTLILLNQLLYASVIIDVKPNKYRVTISNIYFIDNWSLNSETSNNNHTQLSDMVLTRNNEIKTSKTFSKGMSYLNQHFTEKFNYNPSNTSW